MLKISSLILGTLSPLLFGLSFLVAQSKNSLPKSVRGFTFQLAPGIGFDKQRMRNSCLKPVLFNLTSGIDYAFDNGHVLGIEYLGDDQKANKKAILSSLEEASSDSKLIELTKNYNNTFQFGLHYGYMFAFKNDLCLRMTIGFGPTWLSKNPYLVELYPNSTGDYAYKRFMTLDDESKRDEWALYGSLKLDFIYPLFEEINLYGGTSFVYSQKSKSCVYAEEEDKNGDIQFIYYKEPTIVERIGFHLGANILMSW